MYKQYRKKVWDSTQLSELYGKQCITRENIDARIEPMQHGPQKNKTTKKNGWRPLDIANMANEIEEERRFKTNMDKTVRLFHIYISIYYPNWQKHIIIYTVYLWSSTCSSTIKIYKTFQMTCAFHFRVRYACVCVCVCKWIMQTMTIKYLVPDTSRHWKTKSSSSTESDKIEPVFQYRSSYYYWRS